MGGPMSAREKPTSAPADMATASAHAYSALPTTRSRSSRLRWPCAASPGVLNTAQRAPPTTAVWPTMRHRWGACCCAALGKQLSRADAVPKDANAGVQQVRLEGKHALGFSQSLQASCIW